MQFLSPSILLWLFLFATNPLTVQSTVWLNSLFTDNMVLQTRNMYGQRSFIYGEASAAEEIQLNVTQRNTVTTYTGIANATGDWIIQLNPMNPTSDQDLLTITVAGSSDGYQKIISMKNVAVGEVFLCSGQSNMVFSVMGAFGGETIASKSYPNMRLFPVAIGGSPTEQRDFPPADPDGVCWWSRTPSPNPKNSTYTCNQWQTAVPGVTDYFSAVCFLTALEVAQNFIGTNVTFGLIYSAYGGTPVQYWTPIESYNSCHVNVSALDSPQTGNENKDYTSVEATYPPAGLFNYMIHPIVSFSIRAVLWYQGENNIPNPDGVYTCLFNAMIQGWRARWKIGDFAFHFVQLATQTSSVNPNYDWNHLRLEQMTALPLPGINTTDTTGMAVTYDLGDPTSPYTSIHPRNKTEVARRLALQVLHTAYALQYPRGESWLTYFNPVPVRTQWITMNSTNLVEITFTTLDNNGIYVANTANCWECCINAKDTFQIANNITIGPWMNTTFTLYGTGPATVVLVNPLQSVTDLSNMYIRYVPGTYPQCAVYSVGSAIPAAPFTLPIVNTNMKNIDTIRSTDQVNDDYAHVRAELLRQRRYAVPIAERNNGTWTEWKGKTIPSSSFTNTGTVGIGGYNSWNSLHCNVDESLLRRTADVLISTGLAVLGYDFVNSDDCWQVDRYPNGTIIEDPVRFPSGIKALVDYIHSKGLRAGLYTSATNLTCQERPGAYGFEAIDASTYCSWSLDYLKIDNCGGTRYPDINTSWIKFHQGFQQCIQQGGRPIIQSVEYCHDSSCGGWIKETANLWRTTGDIQATWSSMTSNLDLNNEMAPYADPASGYYNDPDLLLVGDAGLTFTEQQSQFSAWVLVMAPLLISADVVDGLNTDSLYILSAPEVLAVHQDTLGVQGIRVSAANSSGTECWAKPLADGSVAALFFNRGDTADDVTCSWSELGLPSDATALVRDLWNRNDIGNFTGSYTAPNVLRHGVLFAKVTPS